MFIGRFSSISSINQYLLILIIKPNIIIQERPHTFTAGKQVHFRCFEFAIKFMDA